MNKPESIPEIRKLDDLKRVPMKKRADIFTNLNGKEEYSGRGELIYREMQTENVAFFKIASEINPDGSCKEYMDRLYRMQQDATRVHCILVDIQYRQRHLAPTIYDNLNPLEATA